MPPVPKDPSARRRRNKRPEFDELPVEGFAGDVPSLPANGFRFKDATKRWYVTWARSPQATRFTVTDWQRLHMLAPLVDGYFRDPSVQLMAEIRLQESKLGATPEDRQRLRWRVADADDGGDADVRPMRSSGGDPRLKAV